jgi:hypothetical protein
MKTSRLLATAALAFGLFGASSAFAADRYEVRTDYNRVAQLRSEVMQDRMRLNAAMRRGDYRAAQRMREELARDQRRLDAMTRETRRDQRDYRNGYNGYNDYDRYNR